MQIITEISSHTSHDLLLVARIWAKGNPYSLLEACKLVLALCSVWQFLRKLTKDLPQDPTTELWMVS